MEIDGTNLNLISQGAEAKVYIIDYLGDKAILKQRLFKKYRLPELDEQLSNDRIKQEVKNMAKARKTGVNTPYIINLDIKNRRIYMQYIESTKLRDYLFSIKHDTSDRKYEDLKFLMKDIATCLAKMHALDLIHGDLTSSNLLLKHFPKEEDENGDGLKLGEKFYNQLYFIDFGLSYVKNNANDKAIDLYVLEKAFISTHPEREREYLLQEYEKFSEKCKEVIQKLDKVRLMGRKKVAFG